MGNMEDKQGNKEKGRSIKTLEFAGQPLRKTWNKQSIPETKQLHLARNVAP